MRKGEGKWRLAAWVADLNPLLTKGILVLTQVETRRGGYF
jgi:hypothetical protein